MTITINALTFETIIGLLPDERTNRQRVKVDVTIEYDFQDTYIDYAAITERIKQIMQEGEFLLIEEAILALKEALKADFPRIDTLTLAITKPDILPDCEVCVSDHYVF